MILTGITDTVRAVAAGAANRAVKDIAKDVKSIAGLNPEGSNSRLGELGGLGPTSSNTLSYPINVDTDPKQGGHYIIFHINTRVNGKLHTPKTKKDFTKIQADLQKFLNQSVDVISQVDSYNEIQSRVVGGAKMKKAEKNTSRNTSIVQKKLPVKRHERSIALYMPPNVQVSYQSKYAEQDIGFLAGGVDKAIEVFARTPGDNVSKAQAAAKSVKPIVKEAATAALQKAADVVATGAKALQQLASGTVITPQMEMMFEGVGRRNFSYTFNFIPKSEQEARIVEEIIHMFKFYMMPKYSDSTTRREMDIPGTFDIEYMYQGERNNFMNRIHSCFLSQVDVQYGGDRFTAYEGTTGNRGAGAPPQKSSITLNFTELEVLHQGHITDGY